MIDRKSMLGLLGSLPDALLMQALSVAGASAQPTEGGEFGALAMDDNNHIQPWNERTVAYNGGVDRPALVDKMWAKSEADEISQGQMPVPGGALVADEDPYLQTGNT